MSRTFVVGDIHGGLRALQQVLGKVPYTSKDTLIFLGDYVDGWSESAGVVAFLLKFSEKQDCRFLRGNHDELITNYLVDGKAHPLWLAHGGQSGKESYDALDLLEKEKHLIFFSSLENYIIDTHNRLFCHAGFANQHGPEKEYYDNTVYWDRTLWEMACSINPYLTQNNPLYPKRLKLFNEIFIGHTPTTKIGKNIPLQKANVWNIDTGAAFKGPLTIMDINTKEYWQSDPVYSLYPDEIGRND